jgi:hypothetical protein
VCRLEEEFDKDAVCHLFCSTYTMNILPRKVLKGMIDRLIEIGRCCGVEMNVEN